MIEKLGTEGRAEKVTADALSWRDNIAIVGMSARFPGCVSVQSYWERILAGNSLLSRATDADLQSAGINPQDAEAQHFVRSGTRLEDAESFDARFFDVARREAEIMDPQHRLFLECAYEALEHAGMAATGGKAGAPDSNRIGVFAGAGMNTYLLQLLGNPEAMASAGGYQLMLGNDKDFLATRVAYKLNLRGPAVAVQTACSTSLAAVHLACQSLLSGECDSALAGGVSIGFPQVAGYEYVPGMILSPDGLCRPFDKSARGTVPGRGAGIVVLKRLKDAVAAGDTIYAVIHGSAWNNDGSDKVGYTAPSVEGQAAVIRKAQAVAGVSPARIGYVEAHGTGTELGDPIEVAALDAVFGTREPETDACILGSVKANMGHADVAAGVAGLIKATLAVYHGVIPPTPNFVEANPALGLDKTAFRVSAAAGHWPEGDDERWAGVSSFGIGGTNVHVVLRSAPASAAGSDTRTEDGWANVFPISAKTATALEASVRRLADFVESSGELSLPAVAHTLQMGRRSYAHRRSFVAASREELIAALRKPAKAGQTDGKGTADQVAFLFPGQGAQFPGMARGLYAADRRFRDRIDHGLDLLPEALASAMRPAISDTQSEASQDVAAMPTSVAQPMLFLLEYALAMQWMDAGVRPAMLLGHSLGELTAAAVAGVFSFEDGLRLAVERGRLMQSAAPGAMLAVSLPVDKLAEHLTSDLWIAAENGPKLTVISGTEAAIAEAQQRFASIGVATVRLHSDRAFHTPQMAEASSRFAEAVAAVSRHAPQIPWLSNVTGTWITADEATSPQYWADQITSRVRFRENAAVLANLRPFLLEVGPGEVLGNLVRQQDRALANASSLGAEKRAENNLRAWLEAASQLWQSGINGDWTMLPGAEKWTPRKVALPTYPFERERFWVGATRPVGSGDEFSSSQNAMPPPAGWPKRAELDSWFYMPVWQRTPAVEKVLLSNAEGISTWLILEDAGGLGRILAKRLEGSEAQVLRLPAVAISTQDFDSFWKEHREALANGRVGLVCCWTLRGSDVQLFDVLMTLLQTAQTNRVRFGQVDFLFDELMDVTGEAVEDPERAVVEGLASILPAEFAGLPVRIIDVGKLTQPFAGDAVDERLVSRVVSEITTVPRPGAQVAYRGEHRWQQVWQSTPVRRAEKPVFRNGGTYLITGGMGGIGFVVAKHLLSQYGARVVLVGRTSLPPRERWEEWLTEQGPANRISLRIQRAKELEQAGGEMLLLTADVAEQAQMDAVWESVEARFGPVHGVVHAAGLPGGARIAAQDLGEAADVLRPKVQGSQVLAKILTSRQVDFLLFCSSVSSVIPVAGAAAYAAANAFQDHYASWCRQHLSLPAVAVNFHAWTEVGMAAEATGNSEFESEKVERLRLGIRPAEGIEVIERLLALSEPRMLVSTLDFPQLLHTIVDGLVHAASAYDKRRSGTDLEQSEGVFPETRAVIEIWEELLGAESIQPEDNFFELGGHSLLGTMVLARVRERFGIELSIRVIFEASTPEALGRTIREAMALAVPVEAVAVSGEREEFEI